jgi:hypothetical protein
MTVQQAPTTPRDRELAKIETERHDLQGKLDLLLRDEPAMIAAQIAASDVYWEAYEKESKKTKRSKAKDNGGMPSKQLQGLEAGADTAFNAWEAMSHRILYLRKQLHDLNDEANVLRRLTDAEATSERITKMARTSSAKKSSTGTKRTPKTATPQKTIDRVVGLIDEGHGVTEVAKILNEENAAPRGKTWYARAAYNIYVAATGKTVGEARKGGAKLASRKVADRAPAKTKALPKASSASKTSAPAKKSSAKSNGKAPAAAAKKAVQVKADPKPSAKSKTVAARARTTRTSSAKATVKK